MRWLLPLVIVAALLVGAAGALAVENGVFRSATPTPTASPAPTATPQPTATLTVVKITATPSVAPTRSTPPRPAPTTAATSPDPTAVDLATIRAHGYTPGHGASTPDGFGGTLYAWPAVCTGSADGYCQKVFFFIGSRYLGTDTARNSNAITGVRAAGPATIAVTYPSYAPQDPLCCPSGTPVTITYHWNGSRLIPSGTPPGH
jgi:hypothetical protein